MRKHFDPLFNTFIESIGGKKRESIGLESMYSPELNLIAASPHISPPNPDLPKRHQYTGPWFLDEPEEKLPPHLDEFLARGSKPIRLFLLVPWAERPRSKQQVCWLTP